LIDRVQVLALFRGQLGSHFFHFVAFLLEGLKVGLDFIDQAFRGDTTFPVLKVDFGERFNSALAIIVVDHGGKLLRIDF
jgi:hypothetical protein